MYSIRLRRDWEVPGKSYKKDVIYLVPKDMPVKLAERAVLSGIAHKSMPVLSLKSIKTGRKKNATTRA
jgi:hypothetical protein